MKIAQSFDMAGDAASLGSDEHRDMLDVIDSLRSQGISRYVDLPQIVVCGDQSSGKSSVLEAISRVNFPTKDGLCTRFATEVILRRSPEEGINVHIIPGPDRTEGEKTMLCDFQFSSETPSIGDVVEYAKCAMIEAGQQRKNFFADVLRIEISGPTQPHLTIVDLPGLFESSDNSQSSDDAKMVKELVHAYMEKPRSIILAVVSAGSEFALQQVTQRARELDPTGLRTMGLITKPDKLEPGTDSEKYYVELVQNKNVKLSLGWHVLLNRDFKHRDDSHAARDEREENFLSKGAWSSIPRSQLGAASLQRRLSTVLMDQIVGALPTLVSEVDTTLNDCIAKLEHMGASRSSLSDQRAYLLSVSQRYHTLMKAAIDGDYSDRFFIDLDAPDGMDWNIVDSRLRAVIQDDLTKFAERMSRYGHTTMIKEDAEFRITKDGRCIKRSHYLASVMILMRQSRGRELPGTHNHNLVGELFRRQIKPWEKIVMGVAERSVRVAQRTIVKILQAIADEDTSKRIVRHITDLSVHELRGALMQKVKDTLKPHYSGHPITYNHYLIENVQKAQDARRESFMDTLFHPYIEKSVMTIDGTRKVDVDMEAFKKNLISQTELNMDRMAASQATDTMEAYYKVAIKKLVDDISVDAIEMCLIQKLPGIFSPELVGTFSDFQVQMLAGESDEAVAERTKLNEKRVILETGRSELTRISAGRA
jgi:GTP-binding protein EngB required for normal cell division